MLLKVLQAGERAFQLLQGKGIGGHTLGLEASAASKFLTSGSVVFDVGANKGLYTKALLRVCSPRIAQVHLFEPTRTNCEILAQIHDPRVIVNRFGLGDREEQRILFSNFSGSGLGSLYERHLNHRGIEMRASETVSISTLDGYAERNSIDRIDLLKLDVEGHEVSVLRGAQKSLESRISTIQFEFRGCNIDSRTYFRDFWELLSDFGFQFSVLSPLFGPLSIEAYSETLECFTTTNFFATRNG